MREYRHGSFANRRYGNHFLALTETINEAMLTYAVQHYQGEFSIYCSGEDRVYIKGWTIS